MWTDTHCHLDAAEFAADRVAVVAAAQAAGVGRIIVPAVDAGNFAAVRDCCRQYAGCFPAYGIHPIATPRATDDDLQTLRQWLARERPVAVGEIGLDHFLPGLDRERQRHFFVEQLKLAREFDLPVLLHVRRAVDAVLRELRRIRVRGGIAHAFNGSRQQADIFISLGFKLGFGGAMTWPRATRLRTLAATLPATAIVLETDAPDIPPVFVGRGRNEPAHLPEIAGALAGLRGVAREEIEEITTVNASCIMPYIT